LSCEYHVPYERRLEAVPSVESASMVDSGVVIEGSETVVSLPEWPDHDRRGVIAESFDATRSSKNGIGKGLTTKESLIALR
jgi:hypothetical protein